MTKTTKKKQWWKIRTTMCAAQYTMADCNLLEDRRRRKVGPLTYCANYCATRTCTRTSQSHARSVKKQHWMDTKFVSIESIRSGVSEIMSTKEFICSRKASVFSAWRVLLFRRSKVFIANFIANFNSLLNLQ
jgi:hypothetical protein